MRFIPGGGGGSATSAARAFQRNGRGDGEGDDHGPARDGARPGGGEEGSLPDVVGSHGHVGRHSGCSKGQDARAAPVVAAIAVPTSPSGDAHMEALPAGKHLADNTPGRVHTGVRGLTCRAFVRARRQGDMTQRLRDMTPESGEIWRLAQALGRDVLCTPRQLRRASLGRVSLRLGRSRAAACASGARQSRRSRPGMAALCAGWSSRRSRAAPALPALLMPYGGLTRAMPRWVNVPSSPSGRDRG